MSYETYLAFDDASEQKYELWNGEVFAMSGGTLAHARIAANLIRHLGNQLDGTLCTVFTSDARIRAEGSQSAAYPDISVICGRPESSKSDPDTATNPKALIEVLSDSNEAFDRGDKFAYYRQIRALRCYAMVSQRERRVEVFERSDEGSTWTFRAFHEGDVLFSAIESKIALVDIYNGTEDLNTASVGAPPLATLESANR